MLLRTLRDRDRFHTSFELIGSKYDGRCVAPHNIQILVEGRGEDGNKLMSRTEFPSLHGSQELGWGPWLKVWTRRGTIVICFW